MYGRSPLVRDPGESCVSGLSDVSHAEVTRGDAAALELHEGDTIYVRALLKPAVELATAGAV